MKENAQEKNIESIRRMLELVNIREDKRIYFQQKEYNNYAAVPDQAISSEMLFQNLQSLIYKEFYCRGEVGAVAAVDAGSVEHGGVPGDTHIPELTRANTSVDGWDKSWVVDSVDAMGAVHAKKSNYSRNVYPGEFIRDSLAHGVVRKGDRIKIFTRREFIDPGDAFYYALGNTITEESSEYLVRFYFHTHLEGAMELLRNITDTYNRYMIPFTFKCLNAPGLYTRCDSAVLYIDRRYFRIGLSILSDIYRSLAAYLCPLVPLFSLPLAEGLGFAENPADPAESFGMNRAKLIAFAMIQSGQDVTVDKVVDAIEKRGYSVDQFYLNPGSRWAYDFSIFNN